MKAFIVEYSNGTSDFCIADNKRQARAHRKYHAEREGLKIEKIVELK